MSSEWKCLDTTAEVVANILRNIHAKRASDDATLLKVNLEFSVVCNGLIPDTEKKGTEPPVIKIKVAVIRSIRLMVDEKNNYTPAEFSGLLKKNALFYVDKSIGRAARSYEPSSPNEVGTIFAVFYAADASQGPPSELDLLEYQTKEGAEYIFAVYTSSTPSPQDSNSTEIKENIRTAEKALVDKVIGKIFRTTSEESNV